jgi:hemoglobin
MMITRTLTTAIVAFSVSVLSGCGQPEKTQENAFTSGSDAADQRAEQRMTQLQQLRGNAVEDSDVERSLYERLGGEQGIEAIVDDYIPRVLNDPRVNWSRRDVESGGFLGVGQKSQEWNPSPENVAKLKKHMVQFISLASGGPATYEGGDMKQTHAGMKITNAQFNAAVGDLQATMDKLKVPADEQKELLALIETTRPQIVTEK